LLIGGVLAYYLWTQWRPYEHHPVADSSWTAGGQPGKITFRVVDSAGLPLQGVKVRMVDPSGGGEGLTDGNGEWVYQPDGGLLTFSLNGVPVMRQRNLFLAPERRSRGWLLTVVVKDLRAICVQQP
jgi:hypothetical protein